MRAAGSAGVTLQTGLNSGIQRHLLGGLGVKQTRAEGPAQLPSIQGDRLFLQPPLNHSSDTPHMQCSVKQHHSTAATVLFVLPVHAGHGPGLKSKMRCMQKPSHPRMHSRLRQLTLSVLTGRVFLLLSAGLRPGSRLLHRGWHAGDQARDPRPAEPQARLHC